MAKDPYKFYRIEARDLLEGLNRGLLALEKAPGDPKTLKELLRLAHTLKGASRVVKQLEVAELSHGIEEALAPLRRDDEAGGGEGAAAPAELGREGFNALFGALDHIAAHISALEPQPATAAAAPPPAAAAEPGPSGAAASRAAAAPGAAAPADRLDTGGADSLRVHVQDLDALVRGISEAAVQAKSLGQPLATLDNAVGLAAALTDQLGSPRFAEALSSGPGRRLVALAGEMRVALEGARGEIAVGLEHTEAELAQVRDDADQLRLLSAGSIFGTLERAAWDAASALDKHVLFEASGAEVKIDAHVLRALSEALIHVVRNAVAHGIEPASEREVRGKPPGGHVAVAFERRGQRVAFVCRDDGRGLDVAAVEALARRRGLIGPGERLDAARAAGLLLAGGLSTSETVTEVAGRGIGLDVVRTTARRLKGEVSMQSEPGAGTTVEIRVPVSLSSARALLVEAGGARLCVPLDAVRRTLLVRGEQVGRGGDAESVEVDGQALPFANLARVVRRAPQPARRGGPWPALVLRSGGAECDGGGTPGETRRGAQRGGGGGGGGAVLAVDRLLGTADVVVRLLPAALQAEPFIAGAALDADGTPQLVLEPGAVLDAVRGLEPVAADRAAEPARPPARVLIIDDSLTTRMLEQSILDSAGYEVGLASSGEEALEKARQSRFDLFLVDIEMPGIDGFEFIRRCNADPRLRGIPAILVTSRSSEQDRRKGEEVGARAYIVKGDFEQGVLLRHIRALVRAP